MRRVDLPTPGSPPTSTRLPGTIPPPNTRFSSSQASARRGAASLEISTRATGRESPGFRAGAAALPAAAFLTRNSWSVFQAWQCGHWPAHRRLSPPHSVHTKVIMDLGIGGTTLPSALTIYKGIGNVLPAQAFYSAVGTDTPPAP